MFTRNNNVTSPPPRKPKIAKIPLPDMQLQNDPSPISRPTLSPRGPMTPTTMTNSGASPAVGRTVSRLRSVHTLPGEPSMTGYFSEPGGGSSRPSPKRTLQPTLVPMKHEDGPNRSKGVASDLDIPERPASRRGGSSGRNPRPVAASMAFPLNNLSRTNSRTTDIIPPLATPQVRPSAMKKKPSEGPVKETPNATPAIKKGVLSPIPTRSRTMSYSSAVPEPRPAKTVNFVPSPTEERIPNIHWQLLPYQPPRSKHCLHVDVSLPPSSVSACGRMVTTQQLEKSAAATKLTEMIIQGDLRWKIVIKQSSGITCEDVFQAIYETYDVRLTDRDRADFDPKLLKRCEAAFQRRCASVPRLSEREKRIGMKRVDLLNGRTFFHGLTKPDADSPWKLELMNRPPCGRDMP